jgi:type VI secretion system secreted protein VgrG
VYNAVKTPPYSLPDNKTQSGIRSRSSKGGGAANYNEIRFEDKKGSEEILIHAEKDMNTEVEHDRSVTVGNNETKQIGAKQEITIGSSKTEQVGSDKSLTVGGSETRTVASGRSVTVGGDDSLKAVTVEITATSMTITAPSITITGNVTIAGTLTCPTITAVSVVSATYSPGVGNLL